MSIVQAQHLLVREADEYSWLGGDLCAELNRKAADQALEHIQPEKRTKNRRSKDWKNAPDFFSHLVRLREAMTLTSLA